jgi:hypothetical protein
LSQSRDTENAKLDGGDTMADNISELAGGLADPEQPEVAIHG